MNKGTYFISGIDTDAGKSYCTAWLARRLAADGHRVITQKFIQTGNAGHSEDIDLHRRIMGTGYLPEDREGLTMPEIFSYPCSPHLAARIDHRRIGFEKIGLATEELARRYDIVLVEGAGGLMVPLTENYLTIDYIAEHRYPLLFVTSGRLGSINHTLLSLEAIGRLSIPLHTVLYNRYPLVGDKTIQEDTFCYIRTYLQRHFPETRLLEVPGDLQLLTASAPAAVHTCLVGLGSNRNAASHLSAAVAAIGRRCRIVAQGPLLRTPAEGGPAGAADYCNQALRIETQLTPDELTLLFKAIERDNGRTPADKSTGSVPLDIDLLAYDGEMLRPADWEKHYVQEMTRGLL